MIEMSDRNRLLLTFTGLLAAYQIVAGIEGLALPAVASLTVSFGILLIAGLLLLILGFEVLESALVVVASTLIPLSLSLGLVAAFYPGFAPAYTLFAISGLVAVILSRLRLERSADAGPTPVLVVALVHGIAGVLICLLPIVIVVQGHANPGFALVAVGGALTGIGGLLLSFLRTGRSRCSHATILSRLPLLLLLMAAAFVAGFALR